MDTAGRCHRRRVGLGKRVHVGDLTPTGRALPLAERRNGDAAGRDPQGMKPAIRCPAARAFPGKMD
jgi:hypothetical protein